jgi:serine/threonine protein kinase
MVEIDDDTTIKIADFGFAKRVPKPNCLRTLCGTAQYVAPEVLDLQSAGYDQRADMWSVGVVVYILLGGYAPFEGPVHELARAICKGDYCFHDKYWADITNAAKQMIGNLLQIDPNKRLSAEAALQCHWMTMEDEALMINDLSAARENLQIRPKERTKKAGKFESLDVSFTSGLGTFEEVMSRREKRTVLDAVNEDDDVQIIEDSTSGKTFEELYSWGRVIEDGTFSVIHEGRHKQSKEVCAVKRIELNELHPTDAVALQDEMTCLRMVKESPFVIKLIDVFDEPDYTYMIFERLKGGELIDRIIEKRHYSEADAKLVARKVLLGLEHCHSRRIAHRNIKAESLILTNTDTHVDVKISDFSFAKRVVYPNGLRTQCGTEGYVAPEILEHRPAYDVQCDIWSVGVVLYILLGGYRPFRGDPDDVMKAIRYGEYKFHKRYWRDISEDAKILISRMLTVMPIGRITATGALSSDWFLMDDSCNDSSSDEFDEMDLRESAKAKVKAAVNMIVATKKLHSLGEHYKNFKDD